MADAIETKKITDLTENTEMADTDLLPVGNAGTSTLRKISWANIAEAIKTKLGIGTVSELTTSSKTLVGAINEVNAKTGWKVVQKSVTMTVTSSYSAVSADVSMTGYTPIGVVGYYVVESSWYTISRLEISGSAVRIVLRLVTNSTTSTTLTVKVNVLYAPA